MAQTPEATDPTAYSIGVFFDEAGTISEGEVPARAAPTRLYFMMLNLGDGIVGYENSVSIEGPDAEKWIVTRGRITGIDVDSHPDSYIVGIGECVGEAGENFTICHYDFAYFEDEQGPSDTLICVGPPHGAKVTIPGYPSYQSCEGEIGVSPPAQALQCRPEGCAVINPTPCES